MLFPLRGTLAFPHAFIYLVASAHPLGFSSRYFLRKGCSLPLHTHTHTPTLPLSPLHTVLGSFHITCSHRVTFHSFGTIIIVYIYIYFTMITCLIAVSPSTLQAPWRRDCHLSLLCPDSKHWHRAWAPGSIQ